MVGKIVFSKFQILSFSCLFFTLGGFSGCIGGTKDTIFEDKIDIHKIIRRIDFNEEKAIEKANLILENNIYVFDSWAPYDYGSSIDWNINPYNNNSWTLYFQSLRMVGVLARAFEFDNNVEYIQKAIEIINSWTRNHAYENRKKQRKAWTDHAVANRVLNLEHFYAVSKELLETDVKILIKDVLRDHGKWLHEDENYKDGNHAIMHDRALIQLAMSFGYPESEKWLTRGMARMEVIFQREVTDEGVCVENSPAYHPYVMDLLRDVIDMYDIYNLEVPDSYRLTYEKMKDFLVYVVKPNNKLPCLGDTHLLSRRWYHKTYGTDNLLFVDTRSKQGIEPAHLDKVYAKSGYSIFREGWGNIRSFDRMTYMILTVSNLSKVHKHADYLSFELYSNGEDLIVDPGHGGYQKNDTLTYLKSTLAHNTLSVDNKNFDFQKVKIEDAGIYDSFISPELSYVRTYFRPYGKGFINKEIEFQRSMFYIKPNVIIIYDRGVNLIENEQFQQFFNFGKNLKEINKIADQTYKASFGQTDLIIKQLDNINEVNMFHGDEKSFRGYIADGPLKTRKGTQMEFSKSINKNQEQFITLFEINKNDINTKETSPISLKDISIEQKANKFKIYLKGEMLIETNL